MPSRPQPEAHLDLETPTEAGINVIDNPEAAINPASNPNPINPASNPHPAQDAEDPKEQN